MFWFLLLVLTAAYFTGFLTAPVFWSLVAAYALYKAFTSAVDTRWVTRRRYNEAIAENAALKKQLEDMEGVVDKAGDIIDKALWNEAKAFQARQDGRRDVLYLYVTDRTQFDHLLNLYINAARQKAGNTTNTSGKKPWWEVLGVSANASEEEIERAYKKLAKQFHPDRNPGDKAAAERMAEINAAKDEADKIFA